MDATGRNSFSTGDKVGQACAPGRAMNSLAKTIVLLLSLIGLGTWGGSANAAALFSVASGNWSSTATWGTACGGAGGSTVPGTNDTATICTGTTVAVDVATQVNALTIDAGATLNASTVQLRVNTTTSVSGAINFTGTVNAAHRFSGAVTINANGAWTDTSSSTFSFRAGGITNNGGTFSGGTGVYEIRSANQTIGGTSPISIPSLLATTTITNTGVLTVGTALTGTTLINSTATSVLNLGGTSAITTLTAIMVGNTVNYTGGAAQTVKATTYDTLGIAGAGIKTMGAFTYTVNGTTTVSSTLQISSATGAKTFVGLVTIDPGGTWNNSANEAITFSGGITHKGTTFTAGSAIQTFSANAQAINCASPLTIPRITVTTITVTNNCSNLTVTTALAGTGNFTNGASGQLHYNSITAIGITKLDATAIGNLVDYGAAGNQTVDIPVASTYYHLSLSGSGAKTMTGVTTIGGDLSISGAATMTSNAAFTVTGALNYSSSGTTTLTAGNNISIGSYNQTAGIFSAGVNAITVSGNWNETGTFTSTGTVTLNGAAAQTISGTSPVAFSTLNVTNAATYNITLATNVTATTLTGTARLTPSCPDYTLTSTTPNQVLHSCPPVTPPANFDCVETGVPYTPNPVTPVRNPLYTKLAGTAFSFGVVALKADGTVETTYAFTGNKNVTVELVDGIGATACASRTAITPAISQTLTFTAADLGRKTTAGMTVSKAYANLRCRVTDVATSIKGCSLDNFSVRPGASTLTTTALAAAPTATATPVIKAGTAFTIGATTTTGATDAYTGTLTLDAAKLTAQPSNGTTQQSGGAVGTLVLSPAVQANASPAQRNNATWNEVGYLYAAAGAFRDDGFTSVDQVGDCVSSTTGDANLADTFDATNKIGCSIGNKTAVSFGRFIPDHFDVAVNSNGTMTAACASGGFTYTGLAMGYGTVPSLTIKAINAATGVIVTQNYQGVFQKLAAAGVTITAPTADGTQNGKDGLTKTTLAATMSAGALANSSGTLTYTLAAGDQYTYTRIANSLVGAYTSNIPLVVASVSDGEVSAAGILPTLSPTGVSLRFGRLKLSNVYGSELLNLPIPIQTQYWNSTAFVINAADSCTTLTAANITLGNYQGGITLANMDTPTGSHISLGGTFIAGLGNLKLTKPSPTPTGKGSADVAVNLTAESKTYLQGAWSHATFDQNPTARATFGVYKGNKEFIYMRENY